MYTKHQLRHFFKFSINKCFPIKKKLLLYLYYTIILKFLINNIICPYIFFSIAHLVDRFVNIVLEIENCLLRVKDRDLKTIFFFLNFSQS